MTQLKRKVLKTSVKTKKHQESGKGGYSEETLLKNLNTVLHDLEFDEELFQNLLCSMPERLRQVREAGGG